MYGGILLAVRIIHATKASLPLVNYLLYTELSELYLTIITLLDFLYDISHHCYSPQIAEWNLMTQLCLISKVSPHRAMFILFVLITTINVACTISLELVSRNGTYRRWKKSLNLGCVCNEKDIKTYFK